MPLPLAHAGSSWTRLPRDVDGAAAVRLRASKLAAVRRDFANERIFRRISTASVPNDSASRRAHIRGALLEALLESLTWKSRCQVWQTWRSAACRQLNAAAGCTMTQCSRAPDAENAFSDVFGEDTARHTERCVSGQAAVISLSDPRVSFKSHPRRMTATAVGIDRASQLGARLGAMSAVVSKISCLGRLIAVSFSAAYFA